MRHRPPQSLEGRIRDEPTKDAEHQPRGFVDGISSPQSVIPTQQRSLNQKAQLWPSAFISGADINLLALPAG